MLAFLATVAGPLGSLPSAHADDFPCAGGSSSGRASSSGGGPAPNVHDNDLMSERPFPATSSACRADVAPAQPAYTAVTRAREGVLLIGQTVPTEDS